MPYMSNSAFSAMLTEFKKRPPSDTLCSSRRKIREAREFLLEQQGPYGTLHKRVELRKRNGSSFFLDAVCPFAMLALAVATCGPFAELFSRTAVAHPPSLLAPWGVVLYADEVTPGNPLKGNNLRKQYAIYWSFAQFGLAVLSHESAWFCLAVMRTSEIAEFDGGLSYVIRALLMLFFGAVGGYNMATQGCYLQPMHGATVFLYASLFTLVSDEKAIKELWTCKGAAGLKCCILCMNCIKQSCTALRWMHGHRGHAHTRFEDFVPQTDASITTIWDDLLAASVVLSNEAFKEKQKILGFTFTLNSIMLSASLRSIARPASITMWDWMHCFLVGGMLQKEVSLLMHRLKISYATLHTYLGQYKWPARTSGTASAASCCSAKRTKTKTQAAGGYTKFKCTASEGLSFYPVFAFWLMTVVLGTGYERDAVMSFLALADILDILVAIPTGRVTPAMLRVALRRHLDLYVAVYGAAEVLPKHHFAQHLPKIWETMGFLIACFVHERRHRGIKRYAQAHVNTFNDYEHNVLAEFTHYHLHQLKTDRGLLCLPGLVAPITRAPAALIAFVHETHPNALVETAHTARYQSSNLVSKRDVVLMVLNNAVSAGAVQFNLTVDGVLMCCVTSWQRASAVENGAVWWHRDVGARRIFALASEVICTVVYCNSGGLTRTLLPYGYR
jgi:hypothetical protein